MRNSKKLWIFLTSPIVCFLIFLFLKITPEKLFFYFCPVVTYIGFFINWNYENIVYSGQLLVTPLTPKKCWIINAVIIAFCGFVYAYLILIIGSFFLNIFTENFILTPNLLLLGCINLPFAFALILSNTMCNVDYSLIKQCIQIPFVIFGLTFLVIAFLFNSILSVSIVYSIVTSLLIIALCFLINMKNNYEKLFINTQKIINDLGNVIND